MGTLTATQPIVPRGELHVYNDIEQGSDAWHAIRRGIVTASIIGNLITKSSPDASTVHCPKCQSTDGEPCISTARKLPTPIKTMHDERTSKASALPPTLKAADNDTSRAITAQLVAERITGYTEPVHVSADMERGTLDEPYAREIYAEHYAPVTETGFMIYDTVHGPVGYSPDGLVGESGLIEIKSRRQKIQLKTILEDEVPAENMAQIQCGLYVSGRKWLDYVSYCGGMPLYVKRVLPDAAWFQAITDAVAAFEHAAKLMRTNYMARTLGLPKTTRIEHFAEMEF